MAWALPAIAVTIVGASGTVGAIGVTELDAPDGNEVPAAFVALIVKV